MAHSKGANVHHVGHAGIASVAKDDNDAIALFGNALVKEVLLSLQGFGVAGVALCNLASIDAPTQTQALNGCVIGREGPNASANSFSGHV